jgi:hypothetical protein
LTFGALISPLDHNLFVSTFKRPFTMTDPNVPPPFFTSKSASVKPTASGNSGGAALNLDDIFGDVVFTPDGDTVFLSEEQEDGGLLNSGEKEVANMASKPTADGRYAPVSMGGGLYTTALAENGQRSSAMGRAGDARNMEAVPYKKAPQSRNHLQYAAPKKKKKSRSGKDGNKEERR